MLKAKTKRDFISTHNFQSLFFKLCKNNVAVLNHGKFQENTSSNIIAFNQLEVSFWRMKTNPDYIAILRAISDKGTQNE